MRFVLVDFNHMAHRYYNSAPHLSSVLMISGVATEVDTTIANYTSKALYRYGGYGDYHMGICLEGGSDFRKEYFKTSDADGGYKAGREKMSSPFKQSMDLAVKMMNMAGFTTYQVKGYEADDLVFTAVQKIKSVNSVIPIDIITNDADLLPLVDEQVSVYMRGTREFNFPNSPTRKLYFQVTPDSWEQYVKGASAFKGFYIPYNAMLLFKLIRGDKSDNIPASLKGYGGKSFSALMRKMEADGVDFAKAFRYGMDFDTDMKPILQVYFSEAELSKLRWTYEGMGLRMFDGNLPAPKQMPLEIMQVEYSKIGINIK